MLPGTRRRLAQPELDSSHHLSGRAPTVASFGRGSPTGVVCYRHTQFPSYYHGTLFVLDWTFGRVMAVRLTKNGASWRSESAPFLTPKGDSGLPPRMSRLGPMAASSSARADVERAGRFIVWSTRANSNRASRARPPWPRLCGSGELKTKYPLATCLMRHSRKAVGRARSGFRRPRSWAATLF